MLPTNYITGRDHGSLPQHGSLLVGHLILSRSI